jgi:hypothetical protein
MSVSRVSRVRRLVPLATATSIAVALIACASSTPQVNTPTPVGAEPSSGAGTPPSQVSAQPEGQPSATETPKPLGSARSNPAPVGSEVVVDYMATTVTEVISPADNTVRSGNMFNSTPEPGSHYMLIGISVTCTRSADQSCSIFSFEFSVIDTGGVTHSAESFLSGVPDLFEDGEFYGGARKSGYLAFIVPDGDNGLILKYSALLGLGGEAFLALQ